MSRIPASHTGEDASRLLKELEEHVRGTVEYIQKGRFTMTSTNLTSKKDKIKRRALIGDSEASIREIVTQLGALSLDPGKREFLPARASEGLDTSERATEDEGYRQVSADDSMKNPRSKAKKRNVSDLSGDLQATSDTILEVAGKIPNGHLIHGNSYLLDQKADLDLLEVVDSAGNILETRSGVGALVPAPIRNAFWELKNATISHRNDIQHGSGAILSKISDRTPQAMNTRYKALTAYISKASMAVEKLKKLSDVAVPRAEYGGKHTLTFLRQRLRRTMIEAQAAVDGVDPGTGEMDVSEDDYKSCARSTLAFFLETLTDDLAPGPPDPGVSKAWATNLLGLFSHHEEVPESEDRRALRQAAGGLLLNATSVRRGTGIGTPCTARGLGHRAALGVWDTVRALVWRKAYGLFDLIHELSCVGYMREARPEAYRSASTATQSIKRLYESLRANGLEEME
ncbi:hypothetical protein JCM24511_02576 [Saitozyma sp. JCM 24511]|nr:hypothetical protein JCM24511_02576 [Saitozyma sp. JCM 24511]